ncbi:Type II restriction/modification system, DNA methylase subunit YeeA [Fibrobacter sp. UWH9]|uniref:DNA methyltransferase n=1 Tax=Fibrobacter sp. UWH9 TaxID=1896213 RepID=UPI000913E66F|nr:DNA methyltransferase [Fibrobacter sp. UWH9]SHG79451.1 Type II restriction/modification system, DNA methylase subunit YeeA [Fibrobacter sp. UWH9]
MASVKIDKTTHKANIKHFVEQWSDPTKYDEKQYSQSFWNALLRDVLCVERPEEVISYESRVKLSHTSYIDAYIPSTKILIEQKSAKRDLREKIPQSDGTELTPFQQAKRYATQLPRSLYPRYVVTCNFKSFLIYDMETPDGEPQEILLKDLEKEWSRLQFLVQEESNVLQKELEVSIKAGELVGKIYDAFKAEFAKVRGDGSTPGALTVEDLHSLNVLCVRLVFCLYAEDAGIFNKDQFYHFMKSFRPENMRGGLKDLFRILDTKLCDRDPFLEEKYKAFPYVNGNLFAEQPGEVIPTITEATANILLDQASLGFDWSEISPTIFGAVFESTLNPDTRRKGGMHYTSIENIHKVIDPLFLDARKAELSEIKNVKNTKERNTKLLEFRKSLGEETFFDPACGSGNFLTETYISLRNLENEALAVQHNGEAVLDVMGDDIFVNIHQFYGIEINDFAATVAKTALWIAECQMMQKTAEILHRNLDFLPLKSYGNITVGNALQIDWSKLDERRKTRDERGPAFDYIIGNPPFVGARLMGAEQKQDMVDVFGSKWKNIGNMDYVCGWYKKCADLITGTKTKCALVSTNSVSQGEQVANLWEPLFNQGIQIDFAYRTFRWDSESNSKAHVHCVIIGFSCCDESSTLRHCEELMPPRHCEEPTATKQSKDVSKTIFNSDGSAEIARNINAYLLDGDNIFVGSRSKPLCKVPEIGIGNKPIDDGNYLFEKEEMEEFIKKERDSEKYFKPWYGSQEFINRKPRYCLWLGDCSPAELRKMPKCLERVENVRKYRLASTSEGTRKIADKPTRFHVENMPKSNYIIIPKVSSERRKYVPMGYLTPDSLCSDLVFLIPSATLFHFGVLTSSVHMAWMRAVCGRLEMRYRYSKDVVYNNFPWPNLDERTASGLQTKDERERIEKTAQAILDARALYPDCSLADLYDETTMPIELRKAHQANDAAVMAAYGFNKNMTESEIVAQLLEMYQQLVSGKTEN